MVTAMWDVRDRYGDGDICVCAWAHMDRLVVMQLRSLGY